MRKQLSRQKLQEEEYEYPAAQQPTLDLQDPQIMATKLALRTRYARCPLLPFAAVVNELESVPSSCDLNSVFNYCMFI